MNFRSSSKVTYFTRQNERHSLLEGIGSFRLLGQSSIGREARR